MWSATKIIIRSCVLKRIFVIHDWENLGFCQLEETSKHLQKTSSLSSVPQIVKNLELQPLHPQLHQQDIRPSSNLRELPPTLVCCLNTATAANQPYPHI